MKKLKYNQVVGIDIGNVCHCPAGRVLEVLDNDHYLIIDVMKYVEIHHISKLITDPPYKGMVIDGRYRFMLSMRKLKQMRAQYDKSIWQHHRKRTEKSNGTS